MSYFPKTATAPPLTVVRDTPQRRTDEGLHPYAAAIVRAWTERLLNLKNKPWTQGDAWDDNCFWTARKLTELANSPWSGYTHGQARTDYFNNAPHDSVWDKREKCWNQGSGKAAGVALPEPPPGETYEIPPVTVLPNESVLDEFWAKRDVLTHLHTFAKARGVSPWAVLGCTLARVVVATHKRIALPPTIGSAASLNLFVGIVGNSGEGKGAAAGVAIEAIDFGPILTLSPGSGEGIIHAYVKRTKDGLDYHTDAVLFDIPEIDQLAAVGSRQGSTVMPILRQAWSGEQIGTQTADPTRRVHVPRHDYRLALICGIQPGRAEAILGDVDGGTPQRFLWLPANDPGILDDPPEAPEQIRIDGREPVVVNGQGLDIMGICDEARDTILRERRKRMREEGEALDGHALLTRLKTAAALALLERRRNVNDDDWQLAGTIMRVSDATRARVVAHRQVAVQKANEARAKGEAQRQIIVTETVVEKAVARVAAGVLRRLDGGGMKWNDAYKLVAGRDRDHFEDAVDSLVRAGQIKIEGVPERGSEGAILHAL